MSTVDKDFADNIAKHGGWHNGDSDNPRDGIPRRYELTSTDATAAHAEARRIGAAFGSFTYLVRAA